MRTRPGTAIPVLLAAAAAGFVGLGTAAAEAPNNLLVLEPHDVRVVCAGVAAPEFKRNHTFVQLGKITAAQRAACAVEVDFVFHDGAIKEKFRAQWTAEWAKNGYVEFMAMGRPRPSFPNRVNVGETVAGVALGELAAPTEGYRVRVSLAQLLAEPELTQAWLMIGNRFGDDVAKSYFSMSMHFDAGEPSLARKQAKRPGISQQ